MELEAGARDRRPGRDPVEDRRAQEASQKLAEAVYAQASAQQQAQSASGNGEAADSDDEVIEDAEVVDEEAKTS
mgnify:CR=1 FL=1